MEAAACVPLSGPRLGVAAAAAAAAQSSDDCDAHAYHSPLTLPFIKLYEGTLWRCTRLCHVCRSFSI